MATDQLALEPAGRRVATLRAPAAAQRPTGERHPRHQRRSDAVGLFALVGLATALRLPTLGRDYWVDEGISIGIASHHLVQIPELLRHDGSPPLFSVILHFWLGVFGPSPVSTHVLALLTSLLVIPVAWWCANVLFGRGPARYAALLAATNPFLNWYATETRMYPLLCALSMLAVTLAVRAARDRRGADAVAAVVAFAVVLYTHNWGVYLLGATAAVLLVGAALRRDRRQAVAVALGVVGVGIAYLPWLPTFVSQARHTAAPWAVRPAIGDLISDPASILGGTLGIVVEPLLLLAMAWAWAREDAERDQWALVGGIGVLAMALGWTAAQLEPSWTSRYLAVALGPLLLAAAGALGSHRIGRRALATSAALLVGWSVIGTLLPAPTARYAKSNVAAVVGAARPTLRPGDLVVVTQTEQLAVVFRYLPPGLVVATPTGVATDPSVVDWRDLVTRVGGAEPCRTIRPELGAVRPGGHVLVINPLKRVGASGTRWSRTVNAKVAEIDRLLAGDPDLALTASYAPATRPRPFSAVTAQLFTRTAPARAGTATTGLAPATASSCP